MRTPFHPDFLTHLLKNSAVEKAPTQGGKRLSAGLRRALLAMLVFALLLSVVIAYYFYDRYHVMTVAQTEFESAIALVGEHIMLPEGVIPRVGKIANTDEFKADPFLSQAEIGDLVLFYPYNDSTVKAILWRPNVGRIVDVSLITLPDPVE